MLEETWNTDGRECRRYTMGKGAEWLLLQPVDEHDLEGMDEELNQIATMTEKAFELVAVKVNDWQTELTPWAAPAVFGRTPFGDGAQATLKFITGRLLPLYPTRRVLLGGYSLAGLFALWAGYQCSSFKGIAAVSPSVWYSGWIDFAQSHTPQTDAIYLSLGDKEERTKNAVMARVGDCIRLQYDLLQEQIPHTRLEWNEGNHFRDAALRTAKGFAWLMNNYPSTNSM